MTGPDLMATIAAAASPREYDAARLAADVLVNTDLVKPKDVWPLLRTSVARVLRHVAEQARVDAQILATEHASALQDFAAACSSAATTLEQEIARESYNRAKQLVREYPGMLRHAKDVMRWEWKVFHGYV